MMVDRLLLGLILTSALTAAAAAQGQQPPPKPHGRLFPPKDLGLLEAPDRVVWQHPEEVMDTLGIAEASVVADVGAGAGWFTIQLARRVGPNGIVYAEDVQQEMLTAISRRAATEGLRNVKPTLGKLNDPQLPARSIDAVLLVNSYHEIGDRVTLLQNIARALRPNGRIGIIDFKLQGSGPGPAIEERVSPETVITDAEHAGLRLRSHATFMPYQFLLIFERAIPPPARKTSTPPAAQRLQH
jgi:ubiquinone/menaquinone biosynthesis C-methylase UbiE